MAQSFDQSPLAALYAEQGLPPANQLFNQRNPTIAVLHEQPHHRAMIWLRAKGNSIKEIARLLDFSPTYVSEVLRQPWAVERILDELNKAGTDAVRTLISTAAPDAVATLISIMTDEDAKNSDRATCARDILDRNLGKPKQEVEVHQSTAPEDLADLDKRIAEVNAELRQMGVITAN